MKQGALLDVGGTLLGSNDAETRSWLEALEGAGIALPYERVRPLVGKHDRALLRELAGVDETSAEGNWIEEHRLEILRSRYLPDLAPTPGARPLVERMRDDGLRLVVLGSAFPEITDMLLVAAGVADLLPERVSSTSSTLEAAIARVDLPVERLVLVADTPWDLETAQHAVLDMIGLRCGGFDARDLKGAIAVYDDPAEMLTRYDTSPLARHDERRGSRARLHAV